MSGESMGTRICFVCSCSDDVWNCFVLYLLCLHITHVHRGTVVGCDCASVSNSHSFRILHTTGHSDRFEQSNNNREKKRYIPYKFKTTATATKIREQKWERKKEHVEMKHAAAAAVSKTTLSDYLREKNELVCDRRMCMKCIRYFTKCQSPSACRHLLTPRHMPRHFVRTVCGNGLVAKIRRAGNRSVKWAESQNNITKHLIWCRLFWALRPFAAMALDYAKNRCICSGCKTPIYIPYINVFIRHNPRVHDMARCISSVAKQQLQILVSPFSLHSRLPGVMRSQWRLFSPHHSNVDDSVWGGQYTIRLNGQPRTWWNIN